MWCQWVPTLTREAALPRVLWEKCVVSSPPLGLDSRPWGMPGAFCVLHVNALASWVGCYCHSDQRFAEESAMHCDGGHSCCWGATCWSGGWWQLQAVPYTLLELPVGFWHFGYVFHGFDAWAGNLRNGTDQICLCVWGETWFHFWQLSGWHGRGAWMLRAAW